MARRRRIDPRLGKKSARNLTRASRSPWVTPTFVGAFARNARLQAPAMQRPRLPKPTDCGLTLRRGISKKLSPSLRAASYCVSILPSWPGRARELHGCRAAGARSRSTCCLARPGPTVAPSCRRRTRFQHDKQPSPCQGRSARTDRVLLEHLPVADDHGGSDGLGAGCRGGCVFQARPTRNPMRLHRESPVTGSLCWRFGCPLATALACRQGGAVAFAKVVQCGNAVLHLV